MVIEKLSGLWMKSKIFRHYEESVAR